MCTHAKGIHSDISICRNLSFPSFFDRLVLIEPDCAYSRRANLLPGFTFDTLRSKLNLPSKWIKFRNLGTCKIFIVVPFGRKGHRSVAETMICRTLYAWNTIYIIQIVFFLRLPISISNKQRTSEELESRIYRIIHSYLLNWNYVNYRWHFFGLKTVEHCTIITPSS